MIMWCYVKYNKIVVGHTVLILVKLVKEYSSEEITIVTWQLESVIYTALDIWCYIISAYLNIIYSLIIKYWKWPVTSG